MKLTKQQLKQIIKEELETIFEDLTRRDFLKGMLSGAGAATAYAAGIRPARAAEGKNEENYRLIIGEPVCMFGKCQASWRVIHLETGDIVAAVTEIGKTEEEAAKAAESALVIKLQELGLDLSKIKILGGKQ